MTLWLLQNEAVHSLVLGEGEGRVLEVVPGAANPN